MSVRDYSKLHARFARQENRHAEMIACVTSAVVQEQICLDWVKHHMTVSHWFEHIAYIHAENLKLRGVI